MKLSRQRAFLSIALFPGTLGIAPHAAAQAGGMTAEEAMAQARDAYLPSTLRPRECGPSAEGEIVVCAPDDSRNRIPSTTQSDPGSEQARDLGDLRPPDLGPPSCAGKPGCITGGWAPPPIYIIDLKAIPEAPAGSEADRIARGEKRAR